MNRFFITVGYSGLSPVAPGTVGSLVALVMGVALLLFAGTQTLFLATLLATVAGIKMIDAYEAHSGMHDDKSIVIDELAGMWLALGIAPGVQISAESLLDLTSGHAVMILSAFGLFRLFDITKPSYIGRIDRNVKGGLGVMGDDLLAGVCAGVCAALLWQAWLWVGEMAGLV